MNTTTNSQRGFKEKFPKFQANIQKEGLDACLVHATESNRAYMRYSAGKPVAQIIRICFIALFLIPGAGNVSAQLQTVDYRYAPQWYQSCICFPDDSYKTLVGPLGQMLYDYNHHGKFFGFTAGGNDGFRTVLHFLADERMKFTGQRIYSARVPLIITEATCLGMTVTQEAFAIGLDYTRNRSSTKQENREDVILTTITNTTGKTQTFKPLLVVNVDHNMPVTVSDGVALVKGKARIIPSEKIVRVRQNTGNFKTFIEMEPIRLASGEKKKIVFLYDNGLPSALADEMQRDPAAMTGSVEALKSEMIDYWENRSGIPFDLLTIPDKEIQNLIDASLRGIWQAREIKKERIAFQVGPTAYRTLFIVDGAFLLETAAMFDRGLEARDGVEYTLSFQKEDGSFRVLNTFWKENGIVLWTCIRHAMLTQDKAWLTSKWPVLKKTVDFIKELRSMTLQNDIPLDDGLIPPGYIDGGLNGDKQAEYSNIYWNLVGLKAMIQAAEWLGEKKDAQAFKKEYADFFATFQKAAERDMDTDVFGNRYLNVMMDPQFRSLPQRAQWAFCQGVYPGQIFEMDDPVATGTMNMLKTTLHEGIVMGTGWDIDGIWSYFAGFFGHACLWMGDGKSASESLYAFANHASPLYAWREEQAPRDMTPNHYVGDMPHNWASAEFASLAVHMLALDRGDELHLLEGFPPEWRQPGMRTALKDIATPFGKLTFALQVDASGKTATMEVEPLKDASCKGVFLHLGDWGVSQGTNIIRLDAKKRHTISILLKY